MRLKEKQFNEKFDDNKNVSKHLNLKKARWPEQEQKLARQKGQGYENNYA
ncbi:hypothetical protein K8S19_10485 [bacterium]|nr:hypothetical protein [bacterium]